jgi:hypothetical protein
MDPSRIGEIIASVLDVKPTEASGGEIAGAPCRHEPEPAVATTGTAWRSATVAGTHFQPLHRGI